MRKKLKSSGGFTTVEMLCAVVILSLLCLMMGTGLQMAAKAYRDITAESEIRLLLNTAANALEDKLRYAVVTAEPAGDGDTGYKCKEVSIGSVKADAGRILIAETPLLPDGAYGSAAGASGERRYEVETCEVEPDFNEEGTEVMFKVTVTVKERNGTISETTELTVRCLNPPKIRERE